MYCQFCEAEHDEKQMCIPHELREKGKPSPASAGYESMALFPHEVEFQLGIMRNVERQISKQRRKRTQNWKLVQDFMLGNTSQGGSTSCHLHCHWMGVDPEGYTFW